MQPTLYVSKRPLAMSSRVKMQRIKTKQCSAPNSGACCDDEVSLSQKRNREQSRSKTKRQPAPCMICKRSFTSKKMLNDHNAKHHFFRHCPNCSATFQQTKKFILHLRSHLDDLPYECKICLLCFQTKQLLLDHKKIGHTDVKAFTCNTCSDAFINFHSLTRHRLIQHRFDTSGLSPFACSKCDAVFSNIRDTIVHVGNHLHRCKICIHKEVTFRKIEDLMYHMFFDHELKKGNSGFEMDISEFHKNTGNGKLEEDSDSDSFDDYCSSDNDSVPDIDNNYQKEAVEPVYNLKHKNKFICFICYALYPSPELLKSHMKPHNWYPCNSCPRFFADNETFKKHKQDCAGPSFFVDNETFKQHKQDCTDNPSFIRNNCDAKSECKNCGAEIECKNCKRNLSNVAGDISEGSISVSPKQEMPRYPITKYCARQNREKLHDFIEYIKRTDKPLDVFCISHIGSHMANLKIILEDKDLRSLFPAEWVPGIEFLYFKFQDLRQNLYD